MLKVKKSLLSVFIVIIMITGFAISSNAASKSLSPENALENVLQNLIKEDYNAYIDHVTDDRFETKKQMIEEYTQIYSENPLNSFNVSDSKQISENQVGVTIELSYQDGEVSETNILMENINGEWKLMIKDLTPDQSKVIKEGQQSDKDNSIQEVVICGYNFASRLDGSTFYSNCSFKPPSAGLILSLSYQIVSQGPTKVISPKITYSVVKKSLFGDTVYGSKTVNGSAVYSNKYALNIGTGRNKEGLKLRFKTNSDSASVKWDGSGTLEY